MTPLRTLIVDDEHPARRWLRKLLASHPEIEIVDEADSVRSAREKLPEIQPDLVFLDIQMPPATGFDLLPYLSPRTKVIFVTAFDSFAVKAFDANALDYLLKPVNPDRLAEAVSRLRNQYGAAPGFPTIATKLRDDPVARADAGAATNALLQIEDLLPLRDRDIMRMIPVGQIAAIQAEGAYSRLIISGAPPMMILHTISDWETRLPCPPFARLDRSRIVNLTRVNKAAMVSRNKTVVSLREVDVPFVLGRAASQRLRQLCRV